MPSTERSDATKAGSAAADRSASETATRSPAAFASADVRNVSMPTGVAAVSNAILGGIVVALIAA